MKAVIVKGASDIEIIEKDVVAPSADEVAIKIAAVGVCGTDTQVFLGKNKYAKLPIVPFHEGIGTVCGFGDNVQGFEIGQHVVIRPILACGECKPCLNGSHNACENFNSLGVQSNGIGCEVFNLNKDYVIKIDEKLDYDKAVLIEPFAVGVHAARRGDVKGKNVIVVGGGTIGNFTAQACKLAGASKVAIFDVSDDKIEMAKKSGIEITVNTMGKAFADAMVEAFGKFNTDVIIDCAGVASVFSQMITSAHKTSTIVIIGNYSQEVSIELSQLQRNELNVLGSITYTKSDFETAVKHIEDGKVYLDGFITKKYSIDNVVEGMKEAAAKKGEIMKMVFEF